MNQRFYVQRMPKNPIMQALSLLLFGVVLIGAILMGAIVLTIVIGFAAVAAVVLWLRIWWISRKMRRAQARDGSSRASRTSRGSDSDFIEVEYKIRGERDDNTSRRR